MADQKGLVKERQIETLVIGNENISEDAGIQTAKLADGNLFVKADGSVPFFKDQSMGDNKLTSLKKGEGQTDAVNVSQLNQATTWKVAEW